MFFNFAIALVVVGLIVRLLAVLQNHSFSLDTKTPGVVCVSGVYRFVRHPSYLGTLLIVCGASYVFSGFYESILFSYLFWVILSDLARREEVLIMQSVNSALYSVYKESTGFIFPKVF